MRAELIEEFKAAREEKDKLPTRSKSGKKKLPAAMEATKWKPGQSGNPSGRPKRDIANEIAVAVFEKNPELIYNAMVAQLAKGNPYAFKEYSVRAFGNVEQKIAITDQDEVVRRLMAARQRLLKSPEIIDSEPIVTKELTN